MIEFTTVAKVGAIPEGEGRAFSVAGRMVGIFLIDGEYFAINDLCTHMGASLASGHVEDHAVTCPWHAWRFSVKDGTWLDNPRVKTDSYPVQIDGDNIQVQVEPREDPSSTATDSSACAPSSCDSQSSCTDGKNDQSTTTDSCGNDSTVSDGETPSCEN
jgi:nitrite reductase (NADH) small subunit